MTSNQAVSEIILFLFIYLFTMLIMACKISQSESESRDKSVQIIIIMSKVVTRSLLSRSNPNLVSFSVKNRDYFAFLHKSSGHRDAPRKTGTNPGKPGRMVTLI